MKFIRKLLKSCYSRLFTHEHRVFTVAGWMVIKYCSSLEDKHGPMWDVR